MKIKPGEQSILELVRQEPNVAKRILSWIKGTWQRLTAAGDAKTIAQMERVQKIYSKALLQSMETLIDAGLVTTGKSPSQANVDSIQHGRQKITEDYRKGELTDEEYDAAMDEYDRAEEDEMDQLVGEYSFDKAQKNTADGGGVKYSFGVTQDIINDYVDAAYEKSNTEDYKKYAVPTMRLIGDVLPEVNIQGYAHALRDNDIRHIKNSHGEDTNEKYPVTREDLKIIPWLVENYDKVFVVKRGGNRTGIIYVKAISGGITYYLEQVTTIYGGEPLLVNKQMIKTGARDIPDIKGLRDAITKKQSETEFLNDLQKVPQVYAHDVYQYRSNNSIRNPNKKVKGQFSLSGAVDRDSMGRSLSEDQQKYFSRSVARDDDGNLLVLYHQTDGDFTIFDTRHPGAGTKDNGTPFGIFMKRSAGDIGLAGKKQMALYANITNPLRTTNREDLTRRLCEISDRYASIVEQHEKLDAEYREKFEQAKKDWVNYISEWRSANPGASRNALNNDPKFIELYDAEDNVIDEWTAAADRLSIQAKEIITEDIRKAGYDGVFLTEDVGSWGRKTDAIIALDSEQVKSTTNKNPTSNPDIRYSFSSDVADTEQQAGQGWYDTDDKQLQAKKKGYPVLHGEQVVPFNTWVQTKDRGNYGLVTGLAPENKLLVSFHNKHDGGTADNVAIPYENLIPVPGAYQMTKEEFASLMESEPIDPGSLEFTEEEMREINELYDRARGEADTQNDAQPIDLESLPRKAQNFLRKTQRGLLRKLGDRLGVARFANRSYLQEIVDEISVEYLNSGTVSDEKMSMLFDKAYSQGIVADREFYEQYKHIKDVMRTTAVTLSEQDRSNIADFGDFAWLYRLYKSIELKLL